MLTEEHEQEQKQQLFRDYVGQSLWDLDSIQRAKVGSENNMPQYVELSHTDIKKEQPMTAEEIKQHVLNGLR